MREREDRCPQGLEVPTREGASARASILPTRRAPHAAQGVAALLVAAFAAGLVVAGDGVPSGADGATRATHLKVVETRRLPAELRWAWDVRWAGERSLFLAASRGGVVEYALEPGADRPTRRLVDSEGRDGLWLCQRVASSSRYLVAGAPAFELLWRPRAAGAGSGRHEFATIVDLDVHDDTLLVLGAQRGPGGAWVPDGALAWLGSLGKDLADLHPVYFSPEGPGARAIAFCGSFETGKARFLPDGSFVVVPGVEEGVYLYRPDGSLRRVWRTQQLGIDAECGLSLEEASRLAAQPGPRQAWINARRIVDEILPLPTGIGLVVRSVSDRGASWRLILLHLDGSVEAVDFPVSSPSGATHLRGDARGSSIVLLLLEAGAPDQAPRQPPVILLAEVRR